MPQMDVPYAMIRETRKQARNTGTKGVRIHTDDEGQPTGKVTLRDGRGTSLGSFTVTDEGVKVHKAAPKKARKAAAPEQEAAEQE